MDEGLLDRLREFHGHLGPFAMLGYRAGKLALYELAAPSHFGVHARVECAPHTPESCFVDGIQYSTGCTLGKGNIEMVPAEEISFSLTLEESSASITIKPRAQVIARFGPWMEEADDETAARRVAAMRDEELFEPGE